MGAAWEVRSQKVLGPGMFRSRRLVIGNEGGGVIPVGNNNGGIIY